jgi:hypothetical protein
MCAEGVVSGIDQGEGEEEGDERQGRYEELQISLVCRYRFN